MPWLTLKHVQRWALFGCFSDEPSSLTVQSITLSWSGGSLAGPIFAGSGEPQRAGARLPYGSFLQAGFERGHGICGCLFWRSWLSRAGPPVPSQSGSIGQMPIELQVLCEAQVLCGELEVSEAGAAFASLAPRVTAMSGDKACDGGRAMRAI